MKRIKSVRFSLATIALAVGAASIIGCASLQPSTSSAIRVDPSAKVSYEQRSEKPAQKKASLGRDHHPGWGPIYFW